jgi:hypothetical protein
MLGSSPEACPRVFSLGVTMLDVKIAQVRRDFRNFRMPRPWRFLAKSQRAKGEPLRVGVPGLRPIEHSQVVPSRSRMQAARIRRLFLNREGSLVERFGFRISASVEQERAEIGQHRRQRRVPLAVVPLPNGDRLPVVRLGFVIPASLDKQKRQVVQRRRDIESLGAFELAPDRDRAMVIALGEIVLSAQQTAPRLFRASASRRSPGPNASACARASSNFRSASGVFSLLLELASLRHKSMPVLRERASSQREPCATMADASKHWTSAPTLANVQLKGSIILQITPWRANSYE